MAVEFSWTTFALEIVNFLVLVWILKHFLYKPVMDAVARRRAEIEKTVADGKAMQNAAVVLKEQYEHRLDDWEREKEKARARLLDELKAERARLTAELQSSLDLEREKNRVLEERRIDEERRAMEEEALSLGGRFAVRLLSRLACPALEARIVALVLEDLRNLPEGQLQALRKAGRETGSTVRVTSAFPIGQAQHENLARLLSDLAGVRLSCETGEDSNLIAGVRIQIGPWILRANLQDELKGFSEAAHDSIG